MPSFCRHNRLLHTCPICSREQSVELRPVVSSGAPKASAAPKSRPEGGHTRAGGGHGAAARTGGARRTSSDSRSTAVRHGAAGIRVRHLARGAEDGYHSALVPGLRSSADADRLAHELAFAAWRLGVLASEPPGLCAEVAAPAGDLEERTWLGFLIAYLGPLEGEQPYSEIESVRTTWHSGELPDLDGVQTGPRGVHDRERGEATIEAYRGWAMRAGSQAAAFNGEPSWAPERRFARAFERLALPGMNRDGRFELLVLLGRLGCYEMRAGALALGGENQATLAAKRALGIGDTMLLERRASELARACEVPLEALDLGLHNWGTGRRVGAGVHTDAEPDAGTLAAARAALGCI
ncbi:MAG: hypothetical protein ACLP0J_12800 [Solirubrobacteraceae bacterium]